MGIVPHKLLLADDSVTIQRVIELTFADEDIQVIAVGNGADAIERAQRDRPDIVLADVGMPERNGYEVAQFIKGTPALKHIPVVLLTGAFEPVDENRARSVGCDGVLVKPFEPQVVISRVKDLLAGRQPSGMWGGAPVAQGPVRQAAPPATEFDIKGTSAPAPHSDSLEAYFDHLDAAFASGSDAPAPAVRQANEPIPLARRSAPTPVAASPASRSGDPFADWDPDLQGDPARPAAPEAPLAFQPRQPASAPAPVPAPVPVASQPPPAAPAQAAPAAPPPLQVPSLVEAFTALLSAEQKIGLTSSAATVPTLASGAAPAVTDEAIEAIAAKVLARLSDASRPTILDVAERLVREEIERIKSIG
jgi:CheY-like chemotaxis protein